VGQEESDWAVGTSLVELHCSLDVEAVDRGSCLVQVILCSCIIDLI
jgi:hypothetical protein